jgi:hypothetical protein
MPEEATPFYTTPDGNISFIPNPDDGPHAYDVLIKPNGHFYIPDRTLDDLTSPKTSTDDVMGRLEAMSGREAEYILNRHSITPAQFHIALLHLRIREQEEELDAAYSQVRI